MQRKSKRNVTRRTEYVDPNPVTLPVKFQRPPTLAEQIARYMGAHQRYAAQEGVETPDEAEDFELEDDDSPHSPHELVYDEQLNREMPRYEKEVLDRQRAAFNSALEQKIREDKKARQAAEAAERRAAAKHKKMAEKNEPADAGDAEGED